MFKRAIERRYLAPILCAVLLFAVACAGIPPLYDHELPVRGRFAIVILKSDALMAQHIGVREEEFIEHVVNVDHDVHETIRDQMVEVLRNCASCEHVEVNQTFSVPFPLMRVQLIGNPLTGQWLLEVVDSGDEGAAERGLDAALSRLAETHGLDFIITLRERGSMDEVSRTGRTLSGFGLHQRSRNGRHIRIAAYANYRFSLLDKNTGRRRDVDYHASKELPLSDWIVFDPSNPPTPAAVADFVPHIKDALSTGEIAARALCEFGMVPLPPPTTPRASLKYRCEKEFTHRRPTSEMRNFKTVRVFDPRAR